MRKSGVEKDVGDDDPRVYCLEEFDFWCTSGQIIFTTEDQLNEFRDLLQDLINGIEDGLSQYGKELNIFSNILQMVTEIGIIAEAILAGTDVSAGDLAEVGSDLQLGPLNELDSGFDVVATAVDLDSTEIGITWIANLKNNTVTIQVARYDKNDGSLSEVTTVEVAWGIAGRAFIEDLQSQYAFAGNP